MRALRILAMLAAAFVVFALAIDAAVGLRQPVLDPGAAEGVLRTFDENGEVEETRLVVLDDGGVLWIQSGHHFRGWYRRLERNTLVELLWKGEVRPYLAVPIDTPESESRVKELLRERTGTLRFYAIRTVLLFADIKPVRLDPR